MRPAHLASVIIVVGCLAALPFHRSSSIVSTDPASKLTPGPKSVLGPGREPAGLPAVAAPGGVPADFDQSLAWQPIPMVMPQQPSVEQPPMPNSYYDVTLPLDQPDPIRQRFEAAYPEMRQSDGAEPASAGVTSLASQSKPAGGVDDSGFSDPDPVDEFRKWLSKETPPADPNDPAAAMIEDEYVFEPIQPLDPFPAAAKRRPTSGQTGAGQIVMGQTGVGQTVTGHSAAQGASNNEAPNVANGEAPGGRNVFAVGADAYRGTPPALAVETRRESAGGVAAQGASVGISVSQSPQGAAAPGVDAEPSRRKFFIREPE